MKLPELTIYISHTCDLACDHCFTYNNLDWGGHFYFENYETTLQGISSTVDFEEIFIVGGEPTISPDLSKWMQWVDKEWPTSRKWIVTNGRHLSRFYEQYPTWIDNGWLLEISAHSETDLKNIFTWLDSQSITYTRFYDDRHTDAAWHYQLNYQGQVVGELSEAWIFYKSAAMLEAKKSITWNGLRDKNEQHQLCPVKFCLHLLDGKFYRCPQQALLPYVSKIFHVESEYKNIAEQDLGCYPRDLITWIETTNLAQDHCQLCDWSEKYVLPQQSKIKKIKILKI
jgi:organic radical activating enzyme